MASKPHRGQRAVAPIAAVISLALGAAGRAATPVPSPPQHRVVAYFDWDRYPEMAGKRFGFPSNEVYQKLWVHPQDLQGAGIALEEVCRSPRWYDLAFGAAKRIGFDAVAWEVMPNNDPAVAPNEAALDALRRHGMRVAPLLDLEIGHTKVADLAGAYLHDDPTSVHEILVIAETAVHFIPRDLWLMEGDRPVIFIFSYGFPPAGKEPWDTFFGTLKAALRKTLGADPILYWTRQEAPAFVHAAIHESDWVRPFTFLAGGIHGPDTVTTSLWFDSRGASARDGVVRIVRDDPRMERDVRALLETRRPLMVFHYGLNEMMEGADLLPLHPESARHAEELRALLALAQGSARDRLPDVTFVVDDLCHGQAADSWGTREGKLLARELPALFPFHKILTLAAAMKSPPTGRVLVLAEAARSQAAVRAAFPSDALFLADAQDFTALVALCAKRWGLHARETVLFGQPERTDEEAVSYSPGKPPHHAHHTSLTFLPSQP